MAQNVLSRYSFDRAGHDDFVLAEIARVCLNGEGFTAAIQVCQNFAEALTNYRTYEFHYRRFLNTLAEIQPIAFLEVFLSQANDESERMFVDDFGERGNPLNQISDGILLGWCENDPISRYPRLASAIQAFEKSDETDKLKWKPITYLIIERAPELGSVLDHFAGAIKPMSWSGSLSEILTDRLALFVELFGHENAAVRSWASVEYSSLQESIQKVREWEEKDQKERNERFE